jgi:hypothetical protein
MTKVYSNEQLPKFKKLGTNIQINVGEAEYPPKEDSSGGYSYFRATIKCMGKLSRDNIIEAIIRAKYPTYGSELAAQFNGGQGLQDHQDWRQLAKDTADELMSNFFSITNE